MRRVTLLKNIFQEEIVIDLFKNLVGSRIEVDHEQNLLIIQYTYDEYSDIQSLLYSIRTEFMWDITSYTTSSPIHKLEKEVKIGMSLMNELSSGIYLLKDALFSCDSIRYKREILDFILEGTGIDDIFIKGFAENDLNVSKASKAMYIHRNTMNYKLEKLYDVTGFDIRTFKDAFILYKLIH